MRGSIKNRGQRVWLVRVFSTDADGKRTSHNKTIHGAKDDARRYLNGFLRDCDLGTYAESSEIVGTLLDALLDDYGVNDKCLWWAKGVVRVHLRPFFGAMQASAVGTREIQSYIAMRRKPCTRKLENRGTRTYRAAANATINRELAILRSAFHMGRKCDPPKVRTVPHIPKLKESAPRKGFFERDAFLAVRSHLPEELRPVITFGFYTGCRRGAGRCAGSGGDAVAAVVVADLVAARGAKSSARDLTAHQWPRTSFRGYRWVGSGARALVPARWPAV
jgi:hypothetical protein